MSVIPLPLQIQTIYMKKPNLEIYYPHVEGFSNKMVEDKVNQQILFHVNDLIRKQGYPADPDIEVMSSYEIKTNERNVFSLILINYAYFGGAHGYTIIQPLTLDMTTGNVISLKDLFKEDSQYVEVLSSMVEEQIQQRHLYTLGDFKVISPEQEYYLADKSLVLFYQLYQLVPYAQGFPFFPISLYDIEDLNSDKSILKRFLTFY